MILSWLRPPPLRVLMVCRANVCRSPMAEALLHHRLAAMGLDRQVEVDSAGVAAVRGLPPDPRGNRVLADWGVPPARGRSRPLAARDFERHDFLLAMDPETEAALRRRCPDPFLEKVHLVTHWLGDGGNGVPDPYYGNLPAFERARDLLDPALDAFLEEALLPRLARSPG